MPVIKISKISVDRLAPAEKPYIAFDTDLKGFGVRVMPTGVMSYVLEYRPGAGGRGVAKKRLTLGAVGVLTPDQARKEAKSRLADIHKGSDPAADRAKERATPAFFDFANRLLDEADTIARAKPDNAVLTLGTIKSYRSLLNKHLKPEIGTKKLDAIHPSDIKKIHTRLGRTTPTVGNRMLEFVSRTYKAAADEKLVNRGVNPAQNISPFKEHAVERFLTAEELFRLGDAIREGEEVGFPWEIDEAKNTRHVPKKNQRTKIDPDAAAVIRILIFSGARLREVLNAKWENVDLERGFITYIAKNGRRHIFLPPPAVEILAALPRRDVFVFPGDKSTTDNPCPRADLNKPWRAIRRYAGLEGLRLHDLRHSFASAAASGGASLPMIGALLGHRSPKTTMRYAHLSADPLRAVAHRVADDVAAAMSSGPSAKILELPQRNRNK